MGKENDYETLQRAVFGGSGSELSDDDDIQVPQPAASSRTSAASRPPKDVYESSADSEDDYVQERAAPRKKKPRAHRTDDAVGKATRKRKRKAVVEEVDLSTLPPEQAQKMRIEAKVDALLKPKKAHRPRKKKNEEVLDSFADDEVARLREAMNNAADEDIRANNAKTPAIAKLKMLPEALETLRKASLAQSMIDNNLLEAVRRWLEPLPDRSLPALNIQREFFIMLPKMEFIDSSVLKESGLGRITLFYTKCKRVTPEISRIANELVSTWSRPIIKRSASYRDRVIPVAESAGPGTDVHEGLAAILARAKVSDKTRVRKNAVMIPQAHFATYTVAPKATAGLSRGHAVDGDVDRRRKHVELMRHLTGKAANK